MERDLPEADSAEENGTTTVSADEFAPPEETVEPPLETDRAFVSELTITWDDDGR